MWDKNYWENKKTISLVDKNLRNLEENFVLNNIYKKKIIADLGCGDCISTIKYSKKAKLIIGLEKSNYLFNKAKKKIQKNYIKNIKLVKNDILNFQSKIKLDTIITQRVIINLKNWALQKEALKNISAHLKKKGLYICLECTNEGWKNLNKLRKKMNLSIIPKHNWHNFYLNEKIFLNFMKKEFKIIKKVNFNIYYFLTRLYIQLIFPLTGYGIKLKKSREINIFDHMANLLNKKFNSKFIYSENQIGPLVGYIFKKK
jgi:ubiquinone/menaquinone biosynthesis C-methylase UbiE